jgi:hypothetical protein
MAPETTTGTPGRRSSAPLIWAAGSAVLGVLLFISALIQFVTANPKLLWQIVLVAAILGVLTGAFERPLKRLGTFVHGWNFIWSVATALFILLTFFRSLSPTQLEAAANRVTELLIVGAVGNALCTAYGLVLLARSASNVLLSITAGLVSVGLVVLAISVPHNSTGLAKGGGAVLFVASLASLVESVVILAGRSRPRTDSDT